MSNVEKNGQKPTTTAVPSTEGNNSLDERLRLLAKSTKQRNISRFDLYRDELLLITRTQFGEVELDIELSKFTARHTMFVENLFGVQEKPNFQPILKEILDLLEKIGIQRSKDLLHKYHHAGEESRPNNKRNEGCCSSSSFCWTGAGAHESRLGKRLNDND